MGHLEDDLPFRVEHWNAAGSRLEQTLSRPRLTSGSAGQRSLRQFASVPANASC
jgi:hypothetical protein